MDRSDLIEADRHHEQLLPERTLLLAVIQQALQDVFVRPTFRPSPLITTNIIKLRKYQKYKTKRVQEWRQDRAKALSWLLEETDEKGARAMSLDWICLALGMTAERIRKRVRVTLGTCANNGTVVPYSFRKARA